MYQTSYNAFSDSCLNCEANKEIRTTELLMRVEKPIIAIFLEKSTKPYQFQWLFHPAYQGTCDKAKATMSFCIQRNGVFISFCFPLFTYPTWYK